MLARSKNEDPTGSGMICLKMCWVDHCSNLLHKWDPEKGVQQAPGVVHEVAWTARGRRRGFILQLLSGAKFMVYGHN
jgi:hypothetical protein